MKGLSGYLHISVLRKNIRGILSILLAGYLLFPLEAFPKENFRQDSCLAPVNPFSALCSIKRLPSGSIEVTTADPSSLEAVPLVDELSKQRFSFLFLCNTVGRVMSSGNVSDDKLYSILNELVREDSIRTTIDRFFDIYGLFRNGDKIVVPLRSDLTSGVQFTFSRQELSGQENIPVGKDKYVSFDIVDIAGSPVVYDVPVPGVSGSYAQEMTLSQIDELLYSSGNKAPPGSYTEADFLREYAELMESHYRFMDDNVREIIAKASEKGKSVKVSYSYYDISGGYRNWKEITEEEAENLGPEASARVINLQMDGDVGEIAPGSDSGGSWREVLFYENSRSVFKSTTIDALEHKYHRTLYGGIPFARHTGYLNNYMIEERGLEVEEAIKLAVEENDLAKAERITKKTAMLARFFCDSGNIPNQFTPMANSSGDRVYLYDVYEHRAGGVITTKRFHVEALKEYAVSGLGPSASGAARKAVERQVEQWYNDGYYNPGQFKEYRVMKWLQREGLQKRNGIVMDLDMFDSEVSGEWGRSFSEEAWGSFDAFKNICVNPQKGKIRELEDEIGSQLERWGNNERCVVFYADALEKAVSFDTEYAVKLLAGMEKPNAGVVIYKRAGYDAKKLESLRGIITSAAPGLKINIVSAEDIPKQPGQAEGDIPEEVSRLVYYLTSDSFKTASGAGYNLKEKDIEGILLTNDGMDVVDFFNMYRHRIPCIVLNSNDAGIFSLSKVLEMMFSMGRQAENNANQRVPSYKYIRILEPERLTEKMLEEYLRYQANVLIRA